MPHRHTRSWGALGFNRNRGVCSGGVWCRPTSVRCCRGVMATLLSWPRFVAASVVCAIFLPTLIADSIVFGDPQTATAGCNSGARPPVNAVLDRHPTATTDRACPRTRTSQVRFRDAPDSSPHPSICPVGRAVSGGLSGSDRDWWAVSDRVVPQPEPVSRPGPVSGQVQDRSASWAGQSSGGVDDFAAFSRSAQEPQTRLTSPTCRTPPGR